ncbi:MAG: DegV family protein [Clostridia bacterium]|nr:DegV family protein [Clostridia bacterium]MBR3862351.1 DegV family protein [Clostridia bacterium]
MQKIKIITDSCADLGADIRRKYDIEFLKMCTVEDGKETPADLNDVAYIKGLYQKIRETGKRILTTQVPMSEFERGFTEAIEAGYAVIYIGCALPLSSSVNTGSMVAKQLLEKYPDATVRCIDATNCSMGEGMLAVYAATLRDEGKSVDEIVCAVEEKKHCVNQFVTVGSLDMLKKAGRVKGSAAFFGNLLGVKPIIISDYNGQNVPIVKVKGRKTSLDKLVSLIGESVIDPASQTVYIAHADCAEDAKYLRRELIEKVGFKDAYIYFIGPIVGVCIGPDAIGAWCFGKKVELTI